jgi:hypothetical protein
MGVEARLFLIPRGQVARPSPSKLGALVRRLVAGQWIVEPTRASSRPTPDWTRDAPQAATTGAFCFSGTRHHALPFDVARADAAFAALAPKDAMICWPVFDHRVAPPLRYPLEVAPPSDGAYYDLQLWLSDDYIYVASECVDPFDDAACACGESLERDPEAHGRSLFDQSRLARVCSKCGAEHDVRRRSAIVRDGWTGDERPVKGGAAFTCALVIDVGKCIPQDAGFGAHPELLAALAETLGGPVVQVFDFY